MKKGILTILLLSISITTFAQSSVGKIRLRPEYYQTDLKKKDLEKLKESETFFVIPSQFSNGYSAEDYKNILDEVWTINSVQIISEEDIIEHVKLGNTFIRFKSTAVRTGNNSFGFNYFKLGVVKYVGKNKKDKTIWSEDFFGIVFFTADVSARVEMIKMKDSINGDLLDYRLGYIKNYFQQLNNGIENSESHNIYDDYVNKTDIKVLKDKKLYVPSNILYGYNALTGKEREKSAKDLFEDYNNDYEVLSTGDLSDKILNEEEPFYYIMYHQKNAHKIITVVEGSTGKIIYRRHTKMSYNLKSKDLRALAKKIDK